MTDEKENKYRKWLESQGYVFDGTDLWMEEPISDHSWRDIIRLIDDYVSERQKSPEASYHHDSKTLNIADVTATSPPVIYLEKVNRVEVIDQKGRSYVNWESTNKTELSLQDGGKTLKVFISS